MSDSEEFGVYELQKREDGSFLELGRGAMGITYKALDKSLKRFAALKVINPAALAHEGFEERFIREARAAAQLRHPAIATVFHFDKTSSGTHYYAMEFCDGVTIEQLVKQNGPLIWTRALQISAQVAEALTVAARKHIIHRDIKPSNLMLVTEDGIEQLKIIDFGLAKVIADDRQAWSSMNTQGFIGTAHFASPEQIQDGKIDTRSDIYSLGATLWYMVIGSPPFSGSTWQIVSKHLHQEPDFLRLEGFPESVIELIRRMLAKNPDDRPQTAQKLLEEIKACSAPEPARTANEERTTNDAGVTSLDKLLRIRHELSLREALCLGKSIAVTLDAQPTCGSLRLEDIKIRFRTSPTESEVYTILRIPVTHWPEFDVIAATANANVKPDILTKSDKRAYPESDPAADRVQMLASTLYELLGGITTARRGSLASLSEENNQRMRRAIAEGVKAFPSAQEFIEALRMDAGDGRRTTIPQEGTAHDIDVPSPNWKKPVLVIVVLGTLVVTSVFAIQWLHLSKHTFLQSVFLTSSPTPVMTPLPFASPKLQPSKSENPVANNIAQFISSHIGIENAIAAGQKERFPNLIDDYAENVEFLGKANVDHRYIETQIRRELTNHASRHEEIPQKIDVTPKNDGTYLVTFTSPISYRLHSGASHETTFANEYTIQSLKGKPSLRIIGQKQRELP